MKTCQYAGEPFEEPRSHPWTTSKDDAASRYYDFVNEPKLIRVVLEDFLPLAHFKAIDTFYELLESLNGATSNLESNDCAFTPPQTDSVAHPSQSHQCEGRVMLLYRELALNLSPDRVDELRMRIHLGLEALDPLFELGLIGTTLVPVRLINVPGSSGPQLGQQLMISFWTWGDSEVDVMNNLERLLGNLHQALTGIATLTPTGKT